MLRTVVLLRRGRKRRKETERKEKRKGKGKGREREDISIGASTDTVFRECNCWLKGNWQLAGYEPRYDLGLCRGS